MKKGFTLIELLAVIVILAIIALILVPTMNNVIESVKVSTAKSSAQGYLEAVENRISLGLMNNNPIDGIRLVSELENEVEYSGRRIDGGSVTITDNNIKEARLCVNGYSFEYRNSILSKTNDNYCVTESNLDIIALGTKYSYKLDNQHSFDFDSTGIDMSPATNVVCNNNAIPSMVNSTLHIDNIYGYTKCSIESSIATTFANIDETTNNILMIANDSVNNNITLLDTSDVIWNLNGKTVDLTSTTIMTSGSLDINGTVKGTIKSSGTVIHNDNDLSISNTNLLSTDAINKAVIITDGKALIDSNTYINGVVGIAGYSNEGSETTINGASIETSMIGVMIESDKESSLVINNATINSGYAGIVNNSPANITIDGGTYSSAGATIVNALSGDIDINGGTFTSINAAGIYTSLTSTGTINVEDVKIYCANDSTNANQECDGVHNEGYGAINLKNDFYIENMANKETASRGIYNGGHGTINITGNPVVLDGTSYVSGTMVWSNNGYALYSDGGTVNINGGMYVSTNNSGVNASSGTLNITNARIIAVASESSSYSWRHGVVAANDATININDNVLILNQGKNGYSNTGIMNDSTSSVINIKGAKAIFDENENYVSGIFIVANSGQGIRNLGVVNIDGASIMAGEHAFSNAGAAGAIGNIKNVNALSPTNTVIRNETAGTTINICSSNIVSGAANKFDIMNKVAATVNYAADVIFTSGTNTPRVSNSGGGPVNAGYKGTCTQ